jgi:hypothetical protein
MFSNATRVAINDTEWFNIIRPMQNIDAATYPVTADVGGPEQKPEENLKIFSQCKLIVGILFDQRLYSVISAESQYLPRTSTLCRVDQ